MSNIGKQYIKFPKDVKIEITEKEIFVKGPKGSLRRPLPQHITLIIKEDKLYFLPKINLIDDTEIHTSPLWGTIRTMVNNMIIGVYQGFNVKLQLMGIGYKASLEKDILKLKVGFSHLINFNIPEGIQIQVLKPTLISIHGIDKDYVTMVAAKIRALRKPEPYKGKGIRYLNEIILRKEGKKN